MIPKRFILELLIEFGPIVFFFLGANLFSFFTAVGILVAATFVSLGLAIWKEKRLPLFSLISSSIVLIFGLATLFLHDAYWIVLEYTLYNALFGVGILFFHSLGKPALKPLFSGMFHITDKGWMTLSFRWGCFFIVTALGNEYVWRAYDPHIWVIYRFSAAFVLSAFGFSQFFLARRERLPDASPWGLRR